MFNFIFSVTTPLANANKEWRMCKRWYKWPSFVLLFLANVMGPTSILCYGTGLAVMASGNCCLAAATNAENTVYVTRHADGSTTHSSGDGCLLYLFALLIYSYAWILILSGLVCYLLVWIFLALSGVYCFEKINYNVKCEYFQQIKPAEGAPPPPTIYIYTAMSTHSPVVRPVTLEEKIFGQHVYTGWILMSEGWINCNNLYGRMLFSREPAEEEVAHSQIHHREGDDDYYVNTTKTTQPVASSARVYPEAPAATATSSKVLAEEDEAVQELESGVHNDNPQYVSSSPYRQN
jgi:hypothetical protein